MQLELADGNDLSQRGGHGLVNRKKQMQFPCQCIDGKIARVLVPTQSGNVWMRADKFQTLLEDNGYQVEHTELSGITWKDVGNFFGKVGKAVVGGVGGIIGGAIGGQQGAPGSSTTINLPPGVQGGGGGLTDVLLGLILGNKAPTGGLLPPQQQYAPAPAPSTGSKLLPLGIGAGVLLLTVLLTRNN